MLNLYSGDCELRILQKYCIGQVIQEQDKDIIEELASIGLIRIGISLNQRKQTAKTTSLGLLLIQGCDSNAMRRMDSTY